jgi:transposase
MTACQFSLIMAEGGASQPRQGRLPPSPGRLTTDCGRASSRCSRSSRAIPDIRARKRLDSRKVLCGILFVLYTGIRWEFLPQELGFGSGMTCWRRLRTGTRQASGRSCTNVCSPGCARPTCWISPVPQSTAGGRRCQPAHESPGCASAAFGPTRSLRPRSETK